MLSVGKGAVSIGVPYAIVINKFEACFTKIIAGTTDETMKRLRSCEMLLKKKALTPREFRLGRCLQTSYCSAEHLLRLFLCLVADEVANSDKMGPNVC